MTFKPSAGNTGAPAWTGATQMDSRKTTFHPTTAVVRITYDQGTFTAQVGATPKDKMKNHGKTVVKDVEIKAGEPSFLG